MPRQVPTKGEFDKVLSEAAGKGQTVIVDFTATWCGPCKAIAPLFEQLSQQNPHVVFIKVDVDENDETAAAEGIQVGLVLETKS